VRFDERGRWLVMDRGRVRVFCNFGDAPVELDNDGDYRLALKSRNDVSVMDKKVMLPAAGLAIFSEE
jgi:maltooligosyltrehalose trehalohydrolase